MYEVYEALNLKGLYWPPISTAYERVKPYRSVNTLNHYWCETSLLPQAVQEYSVQRFHSQEVCAWDQFSILPRTKKYPAKNKEIHGIFHTRIILSFCIKMELQHMGHKCVICS